MRAFIYPYRNGSKSVKALAEATNAVRIKREGSKFKPNPNKLLVNWGSMKLPPEYLKCKVLNRPDRVERAGNKLHAFNKLFDSRVRVPAYTDDEDVARRWLDCGYTVVARTKLRGMGGEGIVMMSSPLDMVPAPLYTRYVKKTEEFRIHLFCNDVIFIQRKARKREVPDADVNWQVRNLAGGFIFANQDVEAPMGCVEEAVKAVAAMDLEFGAVDVIWNEKEQRAYVLEINTAPGLEGTTLEKYQEAVTKAKAAG